MRAKGTVRNGIFWEIQNFRNISSFMLACVDKRWEGGGGRRARKWWDVNRRQLIWMKNNYREHKCEKLMSAPKFSILWRRRSYKAEMMWRQGEGKTKREAKRKRNVWNSVQKFSLLPHRPLLGDAKPCNVSYITFSIILCTFLLEFFTFSRCFR